jgi:hypothetical protein
VRINPAQNGQENTSKTRVKAKNKKFKLLKQKKPNWLAISSIY